MKNLLTFIVFVLSAHLSLSQSNPPKLVVGIVVDQMRQDYVYRFWDTFGDDGFKKLVGEGYMLKNVHFSHIPTKTGPGHATIYTGTTPANHGIIGNEWYDRSSDEYINCISDPKYVTVGAVSIKGEASPKKLLASTITDELKLSSQGRSKVISISLKDRAAILPSGHMADAAYWIDYTSGNFVTSSFYMKSLPGWVTKFNSKNLVENYLKGVWNLSLDAALYKGSGPDDSQYEMRLYGKKKALFPYNLSEMYEKSGKNEVIQATPFGNDLVAELALEAITGESLGKGNDTDFLAISFSSTDYIGHAFGPDAVELQDAYIKLDRNIASIVSKLNNDVGEGNYTIFLTSDHGAVDVPANLAKKNIPAGYLRGNLGASLNQYLEKKYDKKNLVSNFSNLQFYLNQDALGDKIDEAAKLSVRYLEVSSKIVAAYTSQEIRDYDFNGGGQKGMLRRGFHPSRSGDILLVLAPAIFTGTTNRGSGHESGYNYDTHVPLIWYGAGINKGSSVNYYSIPDIAPTLSMLLNVRLPNAATGHPIAEVLK